MARKLTMFSVAFLAIGPATVHAGDEKKPEFPPFEKVSEGFAEVVSIAGGEKPFYRVWKRDKDAQLLAELPGDFESKKFFIVPTVAGGDRQMGVYSIWHYLVGQGARYVYWTRYDKKLALVEPNVLADSIERIDRALEAGYIRVD